MSELARIEVVVFLQSADLFAACSAEQILQLSGIATERTLAAGETLYPARQQADALYCVVRGEIVVDAAGRETRFGPMQTVGVEEILSGRLRTGTARAAHDSLLLRFDTDDFFDLLAHNVDIVKGLFRQLLPAPPTELASGGAV